MKKWLAVASGIVMVLVAALWYGRTPPGAKPGRAAKPGASVLRWTGGASRDVAPAPPVAAEIAVAGRVVDAVDGHAIEGAIVTLRTSAGEELDAMVTDGEGAFAFEDAGGAQVVAASADGYGIHAEELGRATDAIVLELDGAVTISGEVVSPSGAPVAGAEVWIEDFERIWRDPPVVSSSVKSGADGRFVIRDAPSGTLIARALHPSFAKAETRIGGVGAGRSRDGVRIELGDTGSLAGRVTTEEGAAAPGATVAWYTLGADRWRDVDVSATVTAGADGRYRFEHLPAGRGYVRATTDAGDGATAAAVEVGREASADVVVKDEAEFAGIVVDASGAPVAGARVSIDPSTMSEREQFDDEDGGDSDDALRSRRRAAFFLRSPRVRDWSTISGENGAFRFHAPVRGDVALDAETRGARGRVEVLPGATDIRITIGAVGVASIRVLAHDGAPFRDWVRVSFRRVDRFEREFVEIHDRSGEATLELSPGQWEVTPIVADTALRRRADGQLDVPEPLAVTIASAPPAKDVTLRMNADGGAPAKVRGRVVGPDGNAAAAARVSVAGAGNRDWGGARGARLDWDRTVRTDAQGRFTLEAPRGEQRLFVYHPELRAEVVPVTVPAQGDADAGVIRLQAGEGASAIFEFSGIGAVLRLDEQTRCAVLDVIADGPAARAGIRKGDVFLEVDGAPLHGMDLGDVIERIRGPTGTTVTLLVDRAGNLEPILFEVVREKIRA